MHFYNTRGTGVGLPVMYVENIYFIMDVLYTNVIYVY